MKTRTIIIYVLLVLLISFNLYAQRKPNMTSIFLVNSPDWVQTNGPGGGFINEIAIDPSNPSILYAAGSAEGIYKSTDGGELWKLIKFSEKGETENIMINPQNPSVLYCDHHGISKSTDGGLTWQLCVNGFGHIANASVFCFDPANSDILYMAGTKHDNNPVVVYKTENGGQSWQSVTGDLNTPSGSGVSSLVVSGSGKLFVGVNDWQLHTWHKGKVFYSDDDGKTWKEINFGQYEDRFIWSIFVSPYNLQEVWVSEGPLYNTGIPQPLLYKSSDGGTNWAPVYINVGFDATQVRVIGASSDGKVYVSGGGNLSYTDNSGVSFRDISPSPREMTFVDFTSIAVNPENTDIIYLPLRAGGIAYSKNAGEKWVLKNNGILNTSINLLAPDPLNPSVVYAATTGGEGTFRTDDYGASWNWLNGGGIIHPWSDELTVDPIDANNVWFIPDVPHIHKSTDRGNNWEVLHCQDRLGDFNFCSVYALAQSSDNNIMYALNNGFGIFKGTRDGKEWHWSFLNLSDIDYTYSIAVEPGNSDVIYSGYNRKPFETKAKIRATYDGGDSWFTSLEIEGAEAVTSVIIDPLNSNIIYAGATGPEGKIYKSIDRGQNWERISEYLIMCTVWGQPQLIVDPDDPSVAYAATWLAGTWKTTDGGANWTLLDDAPVSSTALSLNEGNSDVVYLADRTAPKVWKTINGGSAWEEIGDFSQDRAFLLNRVLADGDTVYASTFGPSLHGGKLYKSTDGGLIWTDISGILPRSVLDVAVDPVNKNVIYVTTHIYGAYKSSDGGTGWTELKNFPNIGAYDIEVDPVDPKILYACGLGDCSVPAWCMEPSGYTFTDKAGVYKSTDSGATWKQVLGTSNECRAVRLHPDNRDVLFAAAMDDGLQVSADGGDTWTSYNQGLDTQVLTSCAVNSDKIYVGTQGCGVYSGDIDTTNWSVMWQSGRSNKPVPEVYSMEIKIDPTNSNRIFVGSNPGGLYRSDDSGLTFYDKNFLTPTVVVEDPVRQGYYTFAINPSDPEEVWLGTWGKGIFKSYDGMDFDIIANGTDRKMYGKYITQIVINQKTVYVSTNEGVYKTDDGGSNWTAMNQGFTSTDVMRLHTNSIGELYAGTRGYGLFKWETNHWEPQNPCGNWGVIWSMWNDRPMYQYTSVLIHPQDNTKMLLGTFPQGIYKSLDGGKSWRESNVGWTMDGVFCLMCHPDNPEIVYSGTYNGLNRSLDFGEHWEMWDNGWPAEQWVFSIDFDPADPDIMYACSKNGENEGTGRDGFKGTVMKSIDGGANWFAITNGLRDNDNELNQEFYKIIVDRFDHNTLYLAAENDGVYVSRDAGENWTLWNEGLTNHRPGTNGNNVTNTMVLSADHSILYFGSYGSGVFRRMITPVLPVNNLCAEVKNHKIILKWQFDDLNSNFNQYNVYRSIAEFSSIEGLTPYASVSSVSDTSFTDTSVEMGVQYYYTVTTVDVNSYENDHIYVLGPVVDYGMSVITCVLDTGTVGISYTDTLEVLGGQAPYVWQISQGFLPAGMGLDDSTGIISGSPITAGTFNFTVKALDSHSEPYSASRQLTLVIVNPSAVDDNDKMIPDKTMMYQNYPNPFNNQTNIRYQLRKPGHVVIEIYDVLGQKVRTLIDQKKPAGYYSVFWDARDDEGGYVSSGTYFYKMRVGDFLEERKVVFLK